MFAEKELYLIDKDKVYTLNWKDRMKNNKTLRLMLEFPLKAGKKWTTEHGGRKSVETVIGEEEVKVPAGTFKAWKIKGVSGTDEDVKQTSETIVWHGKGVGIVRVISTVKAKIDGKELNVKSDMVWQYRQKSE